MAIGSFGESFPYSNFHDLNMDWILKIAKDFLDQYTSIQEVITTGLSDLESTYARLDGLLNDWYETHSEDIADQLADALTELNDWYTAHSDYLDQAVINNLNYFNTRAEAKAEETLESIPSDYSALSSKVETIESTYDSISRIPLIPVWEQGSFNASGNIESATRIRTNFIDVTRYSDVIVSIDAEYLYELDRYDSSYNLVESISWNSVTRHVNLENTSYIRFIMCKTDQTNILPSAGIHLDLSGYTQLYTWKQTVESEYMHYRGYVTSSTMASVLSDANNAVNNSYYMIRFTDDEENILPHLPFERTIGGDTDILILVCYGNSSFKTQKLYARHGDTWIRTGITGSGYWFDWYKTSGDMNSDRGVTIHVGSAYEYTKLTDAMQYAFANPNTTVIVHPGTYNIIEEMGASYWENFTDYSDLTHARIGNGAHFIFSPDARVECNYTGDNSNVRTLYSPFNSLDGAEGDFTIEGLVLRVSGCRYAIHDDVGASLVEQTHRYINCDISDENRCIGAGLGANMTVEMRDCVFRSTGSSGNNPVSWHNSGGGTTGKSSIVMTGCYIDGAGNNTVQFLAYGSSQKQSRVLVSNNRFRANPVCQKYDADQPYMNFEMFAFNNQIN